MISLANINPIAFYLLFLVKDNIHELSHFLNAKKYGLALKYPLWKIFLPISCKVDDKLKKSNSHIKTKIIMAGIKSDTITLLISLIALLFLIPNTVSYDTLFSFIILQSLTLVANFFLGDYRKLLNFLNN